MLPDDVQMAGAEEGKMSQTARVYKIDQMLNDRGVVSFQTLMEALGVSRATLKRDLAYLRDRLNAQINLKISSYS